MMRKKKYWLSFVYHFYNSENEEVGTRREDYKFCNFHQAHGLFKKFCKYRILFYLAEQGLLFRWEDSCPDFVGCVVTVFLTDNLKDVFEDFYVMSDKAVVDDDLPF